MTTQKPLKIVETVLRDGHQSLAATRMRTSDMIPMLEQLDEIGFHALEAWGGATFDACLRFLNEDPWERLRTLKKYCRKTPLQMLLRGQNVLGYNHYADDVVTEFVNRSVDNGIGVLRIFDALNDVRNLETSIRAGKKAGAHVQGAFVYTISPYHTPEAFVKVAKDLVELGCDSICLKDMAGLLAPYAAYDLVKALKAEIAVPINIHTHYTSGMGVDELSEGDRGRRRHRRLRAVAVRARHVAARHRGDGRHHGGPGRATPASTRSGSIRSPTISAASRSSWRRRSSSTPRSTSTPRCSPSRFRAA